MLLITKISHFLSSNIELEPEPEPEINIFGSLLEKFPKFLSTGSAVPVFVF